MGMAEAKNEGALFFISPEALTFIFKLSQQSASQPPSKKISPTGEISKKDR